MLLLFDGSANPFFLLNDNLYITYIYTINIIITDQSCF